MNFSSHPSLVILVALVSRHAHPTGEANLNAKEYSILCRIYNVVANLPSTVQDYDEVNAVISEVDQINLSLSGEWDSDTPIIEANTDSHVSPGKNEESLQVSLDLRKARARRKAAAGHHYEPLQSNSTALKVAQRVVEKIEKQVAKILDDIQRRETAIDLQQLRTAFSSAVFGDQTEDTLSMGGTNRVTACGTSSKQKGAKSGASLALDFLCLCGGESSNNEGKVCGVDVGTSEQVSTHGTNSNNLKTIWLKLKKGCEDRKGNHTLSLSGLTGALQEFFEELDRGTPESDSNDGFRGKFGAIKGAGSTGCDGKYTTTGGPCIFYSTTAGKDDYVVPWYTHIQVGLPLLKNLENHRVAIQRDVVHLKMLRDRAEEIYEETKATLEAEKANPEKTMHNQSQKQNSTTPSDKATAQEPSTVGTATIPRSILPWALLL